MKKTLIAFLMFAIITPAFATISGTVLDAETKEALSYASIQKANDTRIGTITDENGEYTIGTISPQDQIIVRYIGYKPKTISATAEPQIIELEPDTTLPEVNVKPDNTTLENTPCTIIDEETQTHISGAYHEYDGRFACKPDTCVGPAYKTTGKFFNGTCLIDEIDQQCSIVQCVPVCECGYKLNQNQTQCVKSECEITPDEHAVTKEWACPKKLPSFCQITKCQDGYGLNEKDNKCVDIKTLQDNANAARENERSLQHRINDAVGIGGVGIGGMMIGGALAERSADDAAESDMTAYIKTFRCEYGNGQSVTGGKTNVEIPGGNELIDLYARYATLANDLKLRKESLGIKPGIESEVIIDKATSGLYDDVGTGVVGGGYASIARAIMNPTGADAQMWAAQRAATTSKLNTGIGIAATAAALTLANTLKDALKEPAAELQQAIKEIPPKQCSVFKGTTNDGNVNTPCKCKNGDERFFPDGGGCVPCPNGLKYDEHNDCVCENPDFAKNTNGKCVQINQNKCKLSGAITMNSDGTCDCSSDAVEQGNGTCKRCDYGKENNQCKPKPKKPEPGTQIINMNLDADALFKSGQFDLQEQASIKVSDFAAKAALGANVRNIKLDDTNNYCLIIIGHTDRKPYANDPTNEKNKRLSEDRANAVKDVLKEYFAEDAIRTYGVADRDCDQTNYPQSNDPKCRKVEMIMLAGACKNDTDYSLPENRANASLIRETPTIQ